MSDRRAGLAVLLILLLAIGLTAVLAWRALQSSVPIPIPVPGEACHSLDGLPDPICTPGLADPLVTQDNIETTICVSGYTTKVRPSSRYTDAVKVEQITAYRYADTNPADYEEDHLIPLELGGHPTDPRNLWPEPLAGPQGAIRKDGVENSVHTEVCAGRMTLAAAQTLMATNWESIR